MTQVKELTKHQTLVFEALAKSEGPSSAYGLLDQLRASGLRAPQQIYRALDKLIEYGLVHRLESLNAFVRCSRPHDHGHGVIAFAICDVCGRVDEFFEEAIERRLKSWSSNHGFQPAGGAIELHGICRACQGAA